MLVDLISIICLFNLALVIILLWFRKNNSNANYFLGGVVFLTFLALAGNYTMYQVYTPYALFKKLEMVTAFFFGIFLWHYVNEILGVKIVYTYKQLLNYVPPLLMIYISLKDFFLTKGEQQVIINEIFSGTNFEYNILNLLFVIHTFGYILYCYFFITRVESKIPEFYPVSDFIKVKWAKQFIRILIFLNIAGIIIYSIPVLFAEISARTIELIYIPIVCSGMYLYIVFKAFSCSAILTKEEFSNYTTRLEDFHLFRNKRLFKNSEERTISAQSKETYQRIMDLVESEKLYLNESFNLKSLSEASSIPVHQLSQIINLYAQKNFSEWINHYWIEESKNLLTLKPHFTIEAIAYESGFGSKATFNRVFKKYNGVTPSEYMKSNYSIISSK